MSAIDQTNGIEDAGHDFSRTTATCRIFSWVVTATTFIFVANSFLIFGLDWPGFATLVDHLELFGQTTLRKPLEDSAITLGWVQALSYAFGFAGPALYVSFTPARTLRQDAAALRAITNYIIRAAFWSVVLVGLADMVISFLRVEGFLEAVVGADTTKELGRAKYRGPMVHLPLIGVAMLIAARSRSLGFTWLALLVVVAELSIVLSRFIFSYEQAFQGDLVRFWYAALFLFSSAYTLFEDGHVRVDVLYAGFSSQTKGLVNAVGSVLLGMSLCWVVLALGMAGKSSIISSPLLNFEVSQSGFGMYVKYLMAGFLGIFAISMMIQFASLFLDGIADYRKEPGGRQTADAGQPAH